LQQTVAADFVDFYNRQMRPGEGVMMRYAAWMVSAQT
jgi:hypothetical protein